MFPLNTIKNAYKNFVIVLFFVVVAIMLISAAHATNAFASGPSGASIAAANAAVASGKTIDLTNLAGMAGDAIGSAIAWVMYQIALGIGGVIAGLGALLLDLSFTHTILNFGTYLNASGDLGKGIIGVWIVFRDTINIVFIFGLIYIGIRTILNSDDSSTRRALGLLIVAALFINFSLYITEVIIDFSNIVAVQMYNQIVNQAIGATGGTSAIDTGPSNVENIFHINHQSITGAFLTITGVTSFFGQLPKDGVTSGEIMVYSIFLMIFLIAAGIVFAMGAFLLIARFIALMIYMMLSPAMFIGFILPSLHEQQDKWRKGFIKQAIFAPAFLFMLYLSIMVLQRLKIALQITSGVQYTDLATAKGVANGGVFLMLLFFIIMLGLLYASIRVGQTAGVFGAAASAKGLRTIANAARGAIAGGLYRGTVGKASGSVLKAMDNADKNLANSAENDHKYNPLMRTLRRSGRAILRETVVSPETRGTIKGVKEYKAGGGYSISEAEKRVKERSEKVAEGNMKADLKTALKKGTSAPVGATGDAARIEMEAALANASASDLAKLASSDEGLELLTKIAGNLPDKKFESLMDNKELTPEQKEKLGIGRTNSIKENITRAGGGDYQKGISGASADELNALKFEELMQNSIYVQSGQLDKLESKWGDEKMRIFKKARKEAIIAEFQVSPDTILNSRKGDKEIAKLPTEIFTTHKDILLDALQTSNKMTGGLMQSIATESGMSGTEKRAFGTALNGRPTLIADPGVAAFLRSPAGAAFII